MNLDNAVLLHLKKQNVKFLRIFQLTNSTIWAAVSREGLKSICAKELNQNNTLWRSKAKIFAQQIMTIMCPNECSNNGECDNGFYLNSNMNC